MRISNVEVVGLERSVRTCRYPMVVDVDEFNRNYDDEAREKAFKTAKNLAKQPGDSGHPQFLSGIHVYFDLSISIQAWQEFERYKFLYFVSSTSKMHRLSEMPIKACCNKYVDLEIAKIAEKYQDEYNKLLEDYRNNLIPKGQLDQAFYKMIYNIPQGFEYTAGMVTNYRELKQMYKQRRHHRLPEWQEFCDWIETLPYAEELIIGV